MFKLKDICKNKIHLNLKDVFPNTQCPLGNAAVFPIHDETYLTTFREFDYLLPSYDKLYNFKSSFHSGGTLLNNDFLPLDVKYKTTLKFDEQEYGATPYLTDIRLFSWNNEIFCSGSYDYVKMFVGKIHICNNEITIELQYKSQDKETIEKNWLAIPNQPFKFIYEVKKDKTRIIDT